MNLSELKKKIVRKVLPWRDKEYQNELNDRKAMRILWNTLGTDFVGRLILLPLTDNFKQNMYAVTIPNEIVEHLNLKTLETYQMNINEVYGK